MEEAEWRPRSELLRLAPQKVDDFHKKYPSAPRPLTKIAFADINFQPMPEPLTDWPPRSGEHVLERGVMSESIYIDAIMTD